jgi:hypothetical protein
MNIILPTPAVLKLCSGRQAIRRSVKITAFVEWRISGNQIDGTAVHSAQEVKVVTVVQRAVGKIALCHHRASPYFCP